MLLRKTKFKQEYKVNVGDSNVHIWGLNVTSRGNKESGGKQRQKRTWKSQATERTSACGGQNEQSGEEKEELRKEVAGLDC